MLVQARKTIISSGGDRASQSSVCGAFAGAAWRRQRRAESCYAHRTYTHQSYPNIRRFREDELLCIHTLGAYRKLLEDWKERYAPQPDSDIWDLRFCEALKALSTVDYLLDSLTIGTLEQRVAMVDSLLVSIIPEMQERLRKEDNAHGQAE